MAVLHVLNVTPTLPATVLDRVLTAIEKALVGEGAVRIWVDRDRPALAVMAEFGPPFGFELGPAFGSAVGAEGIEPPTTSL